MRCKIEPLRPPIKGNTKRSALALVVAFRLFLLAFIFIILVMVCLASFVSSFSRVAFSGSRVSGSSAFISCRAFLPLVSGFSGSVGVGCASGIDSLVRSAYPSASVFRVQPPVSRASFALRSARMVGWVARGSGGGLLVAFPLGACPPAVVVSSTFGGRGSGTWGSVALAVGLGASVLVVLPASVVGFPAPVSVASRFGFVGVAPCGGSLWLASPTPVQLSLF